MKITYIVLIFIGLLLMQSCKKDKLEGEKEILKGKWEWAFSWRIYDDIGSPNDPPTDTIFAFECYDKYELDFLEKGRVKSLKNDKVKKNKRIVFQRFTELNDSLFSIIIELNNRESKTLGVGLQGTNLDLFSTRDGEFTGLPFEDNLASNFPGDNIDTSYTHYYRRVE